MRIGHFVAHATALVVVGLLAGCSSGSDNAPTDVPVDATDNAVDTSTQPQLIGQSPSAMDDTSDTNTAVDEPTVTPQSPSPELTIDDTGSLVSDLPFITDDSLVEVVPPQTVTEPSINPEPDTVVDTETTVDETVADVPVTTPEVITDNEATQDASVLNPFLLDGTPRGTPPIPSTAPDDCILAVAGDGAIFCFSPATRTLRAWGSTSVPWWSFELPGDNATNIIRGLQVIDQRLMLVAEIRVPELERRLEVSVFSTGGQFDRSISFWTHNTDLDLATHRLSTATLDGDLIVVTDQGDFSNNILPNANHGTQVLTLDIPDEGIAIRFNYLPDMRQTNPLQIISNADNENDTEAASEQLVLELGHQVRSVESPARLSVDSLGSFQSIPFTRRNYLQKKSRLTGLIESPLLQQLAEKIENGYLDLRNQAGASLADAMQIAFECPDGGTAQRIASAGLTSQRSSYIFENCSSDNLSANGTYTKIMGDFCGRDCRGPQLNLSFTDFSASFADGDIWSVQGSLIRNADRLSATQTGGLIENPVTDYRNSTDIEALTLGDNGLLLQIDAAAYAYRGTALNGTGSWSGSGSLVQRDNSTESFDMDMTRTLEEGVQTLLTGYIEGRRSDGTSLRVEVGGEDEQQLTYTVSAGTESISIVNDW